MAELHRRRFDSSELGDPTSLKRISRRAVLGGVAVGVGGVAASTSGVAHGTADVSSLANARDFGVVLTVAVGAVDGVAVDADGVDVAKALSA